MLLLCNLHGKLAFQGFSECARYTLAAKPRKGDAILFHSMQPNGDLERRSLHEACPVIKGVKWSAAKWYVSALLQNFESSLRLHSFKYAPIESKLLISLYGTVAELHYEETCTWLIH